MRIFLWGMMGSGKSRLGKYLFENIKKIDSFFDLDTIIEQKTGKSIKELFAREGEEFFRKTEHESLREIIDSGDNFILSTGGGTPVFYDNHALMYNAGLTIYLEAPVDLLVERLWAQKSSRPLIANINTQEELKQYLSTLLEEREGYYRLAHVYWDIRRPEDELLEKLRLMLGCDQS